MLIGITGRGGAGKSTVARLIQQFNQNYEYIEVDLLIERKVLNSKKLINELNINFNDKKYTMEDVVMSYFNTDEKSKAIHKLFVEEVEKVLMEEILSLNSANVIIDWFLLHEMKLFKMMDIKILITLDENERIKRVMNRDKTKDIDMFIEVDKHYNENFNCEFDYIINTKKQNYEDELRNLSCRVKKL